MTAPAVLCYNAATTFSRARTMKLSPADIKGLVEILNRLYLEIREIEEHYGILFGNGDFRPRIEYFHDAIRAFTAGKPGDLDAGGRLTIELLAYDVAALRYIQNMPLASLNRNDRHRSGQTHIIPEKSVAKAHHHKPDRATKQLLSELYQQYGVLFAALFKPHADNNFQDRIAALDEEVRQLSDILHGLEDAASAHTLQDLIAHLDNTELRTALLALLHKHQKNTIKQTVTSSIAQADQSIATLDAAHLQYASAQLGIYEEGKDILKKLAARGLNLAGKFVESSMAQARREMGRG